MQIAPKVGKGISQLTDVPSNDPDDARRRKLLNIILAFVVPLTFITLIVGIVASSVSNFTDQSNNLIVWISLAILLFSVFLFFLNRTTAGWLASVLFLLFLMAVFAFSDEPVEVIAGRSLFVFTIPIVMSSMLLRPAFSFLFAGVAALEMYIISMAALSGNPPPNLIGILGFFMLAAIAWLSSRTVEIALRDLRLINAELDQRVADRTKELSESLEREAAQASQRQAILLGIADGVVVFDQKGEAILSNPALGGLINLSQDDIKKKKLREILSSAELSEEDQLILLHSISAKDATINPIRVKWGNKTISVNASPVRDLNNGQVIGNVAVLRDFTREAELEEMKNTFTAMVSHELRTPLNAILGYAEMLRENYYGPLNEMQQKTSDRILKNSQRLLDIVSDLLTKAQIEAGTLKIKLRSFTPQELDESLHSVMDKLAQDKGLYLTSEIDPQLPDTLHGDPQRLQQVLVNLVNNAVKFTEKGGIHVRLYSVSADFWAFDIADTGPGMSVEDQKIIFEPFRQLEGVVTRKHSGIGLGLSIVKKLVDLMQGQIFLKSTLGKGSTFTIVLPVHATESV